MTAISSKRCTCAADGHVLPGVTHHGQSCLVCQKYHPLWGRPPLKNVFWWHCCLLQKSFRSNWSNQHKPGPRISRKHENIDISSSIQRNWDICFLVNKLLYIRISWNFAVSCCFLSLKALRIFSVQKIRRLGPDHCFPAWRVLRRRGWRRSCLKPLEPTGRLCFGGWECLLIGDLGWQFLFEDVQGSFKSRRLATSSCCHTKRSFLATQLHKIKPEELFGVHGMGNCNKWRCFP